MFFSSFFFLWEAIGKSLEEVERRIHMVIREGSMEFTSLCAAPTISLFSAGSSGTGLASESKEAR